MSLKHYVLISLLTLSGCQQSGNYTQEELIQHPLLLKDEMEHCQTLTNKTPAQTQRCELAMNATAHVMTLLNERQQDPEQFGQKVLEVETAYVNAKLAYQAAQKNLKELKAKNASQDELQAAQTKLEQVKQAYHEKCNEMKALLGVIGLSSPES